MPRPLTLRQIEAFKAFVEAGSVGRAADALRISQPAVSKMLIHLEADTGLHLFDRGPGRVALTASGMDLYKEIDRVFGGLNQLEDTVRHMRSEELGKLAIGILPALSGSFIARVIADFHIRKPDVSISVIARSSQFLTQWIVGQQIDIALLTPPFEHPLIDASPVLQQDLVCIMPKGHSLEHIDIVRPSDLGAHPFVAYTAGSASRITIDNAFRREQVVANICFEATTSLTICEFVAAGLGIALVQPILVRQMQGAISIRPFSPTVVQGFAYCKPKASRKRELTQAFETSLMAVVRQEASPPGSESP